MAFAAQEGQTNLTKSDSSQRLAGLPQLDTKAQDESSDAEVGQGLPSVRSDFTALFTPAGSAAPTPYPQANPELPVPARSVSPDLSTGQLTPAGQAQPTDVMGATRIEPQETPQSAIFSATPHPLRIRQPATALPTVLESPFVSPDEDRSPLPSARTVDAAPQTPVLSARTVEAAPQTHTLPAVAEEINNDAIAAPAPLVLSVNAPATAASPAALAGTLPAPSLYERLPSFGQFNTSLAMLPQAILAGLLMYTFAKDWQWGEGWALVTAGTILATAFVGKYLLIEFLGRGNYANFTSDVKQAIHNPRTLTTSIQQSLLNLRYPSNLLNTVFTLNIAGVFAYLAWVACDSDQGLGTLFRNLDNPSTDVLADIVEYPLFWGICAAASFLANCLSFPVIHKLGVGSLKNIGNHLLSTSVDEKAFLIAEAKLRYGINKLTEAFNALPPQELKDPSAYATEIMATPKLERLCTVLETLLGKPEDLTYQAASPKDKINSLMQKDRTGLNLIERFQAIADADGYNPELNTSVWRSRFSNILALACVASATYGLSNFVGLGQDMGESIFRSSAAGTYITGPMAGISMGIMGALTASFGLTVGDRLVGSESRLYPHILPSYTRHWLMGSALVVCALGGMPNVFQSIYIDQPAAGAAFAEIASFLLELFGYLESRYDANETSTMKKFKPEYKELVASVMNLIQSMKYATADHAGPTALKQAIQSAKAKLQACKAKDDAPAELSVALLETSRTGQGRPVMPIMNGLSEPSYYDDSNASYLNRPMTI